MKDMLAVALFAVLTIGAWGFAHFLGFVMGRRS